MIHAEFSDVREPRKTSMLSHAKLLLNHDHQQSQLPQHSQPIPEKFSPSLSCVKVLNNSPVKLVGRPDFFTNGSPQISPSKHEYIPAAVSMKPRSPYSRKRAEPKPTQIVENPIDIKSAKLLLKKIKKEKSNFNTRNIVRDEKGQIVTVPNMWKISTVSNNISV
ncbi:hypothetical protein TRFO_36694 [Tritrichomonas foetus]|uniref:Uncharacterized protein n=1 Tax=Tritrichomonas foetus TaxID=1144522 RepID=A0A1J4JI20_9EUKA|nr:hypothetical protein TRFO_36694 [Tritrichomonas foetus]|eukprot:OHS97165.1 hypothetical protein TRFO_36694 [Tritrichomonas foetus]